MSTSHTELYVHLVWATQGRANAITPDIENVLRATLLAQCRKLGCSPLAIGGVEDHVHIVVSLSPTVAVAALAKQLKGASAHVIAQQCAGGAMFRWQRGYGAFTLRKAELPVVKTYVLHQKEHHVSRSITAEWEPREDE
jgi:REP element-mobilizing transposase RayT